MEVGKCSQVARIYNTHGDEVSPKEGTLLDNVYLITEGSYTHHGTANYTREPLESSGRTTHFDSSDDAVKGGTIKDVKPMDCSLIKLDVKSSNRLPEHLRCMMPDV